MYNWINKYYNKNTKLTSFINYNTKYKYNNVKINVDIEQFIIKSIDCNNNFNIKQIQKHIKNKFNISLSKSSIYYVLHKHNLTYKNLIVKNIPYDESKINGLKRDLKNKIININKNNIISYDEMSIYLNSKPYKGWSKKGHECIVKTKNKTIFNKRYSLGLSINSHGKFNFTIVEGALKSDKFNKFIKKIIKNNNFIFMDNATIHKNSEFKKFVDNNKYNNNIIYNVPYHSHLNPIEYVFSLLRKKILSNDNTSYDNIIKIILDFCKSLNKQTVSNIFNKCFTQITSIV